MNCYNFITPVVVKVLVIITHLVKEVHHAHKVVTLQARIVATTKDTMRNKLLGIALAMHFVTVGEDEMVTTTTRILRRAALQSQDKHR